MNDRKEIIESEFSIINKQSVQVPFKQNFIQNKIDEVREHLARDNKPIWLLILKARQEGCSVKIEADWLADCVSTDNLNCVVISHEKESTKRLLRKVHFYIETSKSPIETEKQSEYEISFPQTNSWFYIGTAGAKAFGRGDMINRVHLSEWAWYDNDSVVDGLFQAIPIDGEVIAESTANGFGNRFQIEWDRAVKGESKFFPLFFSWADNPEYRIKNTIITDEECTEEENILKSSFKLDNEQIAWRREKMKEFTSTAEFMQEYPLTADEAFIYSGTPAFDVLALKTYIKVPPRLGMFADKGTHVEFEPSPQGWWRMWERKEEGMSYFGFLDPAEGKDPSNGGDPDYSVIELYDQNLKQCAELQQRLTPSEAARQLSLAGRYYNEAFVGWESNSVGQAVSVAMENIYPKKRVYKDDKDNVGWRTTEKSRKVLVDGLAEMLPEHDIEIQSQWSISEALAFRLNSNGKYEAQTGSHDDSVIANGGVIQMYKRKPVKQLSAIKEKLRREKRSSKPNAYYE